MKILCKILALTLMAALLVGCFAGCCCTIPGSLLNRVTEVEKQEAQKTETLAPGISGNGKYWSSNLHIPVPVQSPDERCNENVYRPGCTYSKSSS